MASTYSPKLRFELIGAGEQAGLWGTTTNKNIGQLIEQAIAGVTTIDFDGLSGDYTITALDGAPDQSRSAVIKCGYAVVPASGAVNLIIPTQTKLYVVRNDIGQKLYVKTAAQTGGVELEDGEATLVFCDGTDAILGLETAAAGVLGVNGGGTGQSTFSAGFVKSPGGTGALTTSSSISASSDITGTLPTANGGTGLTGFTSSNRAIYSTSSSALTAGTLPAAAGGTGLTSPGTNGNVLTSNGTAWVSSPPTGGSGTVTSVATSGSINGLTLTGGPITTTGTVTLGGAINASTINTGTLPVANGGTGLTSVGSSGNVLTSNGSSWTSSALPTGITTTTGSPAYYGARAWVNFDGTGTTGTNQTIRASVNVSSVYKNATGDYTVNFTTAMPDNSYCVNVTCANETGANGQVFGAVRTSTTISYSSSVTTTSVRVMAYADSSGFANCTGMFVSILR